MLKKTLLVLALAATAFGAQAQTKKELVARILKAQQPGIEAMARQLAEEPAEELMIRASQALPQRIAQDKQEAVAKEIEADVKKYVEETVPIVRANAVKLAPSTVGALLEEKFSLDELKQVAQIIESPVYNKFQNLGPEMQKSLADKLVTETKNQVTPKVRALEASIAKRLGVPAPTGSAPAR